MTDGGLADRVAATAEALLAAAREAGMAITGRQQDQGGCATANFVKCLSVAIFGAHRKPLTVMVLL
jgi:hypothetical protein